MKKEDVFEALNDIEDEYISSAEHKGRSKAWVKWASAAACVCLVIIGAFVFLKPAETGGGYDAGGADMDGEAGMYSIAVYPPYESEENVADAKIVTLSETEAYSFETLGAALPTELPEGYSYQSGYLYDTTMEDGTKYYMLRITFADGPRPEEMITEDGGVMLPEGAEFPNEVVVMVTNYAPISESEIYAIGDIGNIDIRDIWFSNGENVYCAVEAYDLSNDDVLIIFESMN